MKQAAEHTPLNHRYEIIADAVGIRKSSQLALIRDKETAIKSQLQQARHSDQIQDNPEQIP